MATHYLSIQAPYFDFIASGIKTVEGRKNSPKYQEYKVGDTLIFTSGNKECATTITYIRKYNDVDDYLTAETLAKALPGIHLMDEGIRIYNNIYPLKDRKELMNKYGYSMLAIGIAKK